MPPFSTLLIAMKNRHALNNCFIMILDAHFLEGTDGKGEVFSFEPAPSGSGGFYSEHLRDGAAPYDDEGTQSENPLALWMTFILKISLGTFVQERNT
jgi:hypothetical protein